MPPERNALVHRGTAVARDRGKSMRAIAGMPRRLNNNCDLQNQHAENQQQLTLSQVPVSYLSPEFLNSSCFWWWFVLATAALRELAKLKSVTSSEKGSPQLCSAVWASVSSSIWFWSY